MDRHICECRVQNDNNNNKRRFTQGCPLFLFCGDVHGSTPQRSVLMAERDAAGSSARRRRERRLRSFWRHEKLAIQMALSEAIHHSAPRGAWHVSNAALPKQKPDRAGDAARQATSSTPCRRLMSCLLLGCGHPAWVSRQGTRQSGQGAAAWGNRAAVSRCPSAADGGPVGGCFGVTTAMLLLSWLCKPLGGGEHRPCLSSSTPPAQGGA